MRRKPHCGLLLSLGVAAVMSSCSCEEKTTANDSGIGTTDADTDVDTDADSGVDAGPEPVDPEIDWVEIPAGSFTFGSPEGTPCIKSMMEKTVPVTLTRSFIIARYEITQKQWAAMAFQVPPNTSVCDDYPVTYLDWWEALAWCNALSRFEGLEECYDLSNCTGRVGNGCAEGEEMCGGSSGGFDVYECLEPTRRYESMYDCDGYRLPTGPEWEYAAKAGTMTNTYNGDMTNDHAQACGDEPILNDIAWYCFNTGAGDTSISSALLKPIGLKQANPFGLYDMLGNGWEWVDYVSTGFSLDSNEGKPEEALTDPMGTTEDDDGRRDLRGGAYFRAPCTTRAASQFDELATNRGPGYGFRPVRTLPATAPDGGAK